jgi:K+-sensing histidine kinase KdpD
MAIAKEMIDLQGGELTVSSRYGQGTRVTAWLPVKPAPTANPTVAHPIGLVFQSEQIEK